MGSTRHAVLMHLDAAYNLARWLVQNDAIAEEVVQEACMRATRSSDAPPAAKARSWALSLVRRTAYQRVRPVRPADEDVLVDDATGPASVASDVLVRRADARLIARAIGSLPIGAREILVLRELEGLAYDEIAAVMELPVHRVPALLSRARTCFRRTLGCLVADDASGKARESAHPRSARTNSSSSVSFRSETAQNDKPSRVQ